MSRADIISVKKLLEMNLTVPAYQRPYKWSIRNIEDLLGDISVAVDESKKYSNGFKYRIGTIILHKKGNEFCIVDGQQRIISLVLLNVYLNRNFQNSILRKKFTNRITQSNIQKNYEYINEWFSLKRPELKQRFVEAMSSVLQVVIIQVDRVEEAFQLFDSQNTRGKSLDPHDLLKAYHLREMKDYPYEMQHAVVKWEAKNTRKINELFDLYLYRVWNWSRGNKTRPFTAKEIDTYKGISETSNYSYAKRAGKAMPYFQITAPFIAGNDFFEMVDHYMNLLEDVKKEIDNSESFKKIREISKNEMHSAGFGYAKNLFYCALLMYYDKFHNFDERAVKKLFTWAFMLRVDMENLGFDSINKYAVGEENASYTNSLAVFSIIDLARTHSEIANLQIRVKRDHDLAKVPKWNKLYSDLKALNGYMEVTHER